MARSINHPQLARRRINRDEQRARQARRRNDRLSRREAGQSLPQSVVNSANRTLQPADDIRVGDLVQDVVVDQTQHIVRQVLRQLRDENQAEPAFASATGDARDLFEERFHLPDAVGREELVRLFR